MLLAVVVTIMIVGLIMPARLPFFIVVAAVVALFGNSVLSFYRFSMLTIKPSLRSGVMNSSIML